MTFRAPLAVLLCFSTGCTLIGAGSGAVIDAAIPGPYDTRPVSAHVSFAPKDRIVVFRANGQRIEGRYLGALGPTPRDPDTYLIIDADPKPVFVSASDVKALGVEQSGKGWLYGGLIGLAVDATLVVVASIALSNMSMRGLTLGGESGCFC